jgi:Protein of unknown function (DUF3455)
MKTPIALLPLAAAALLAACASSMPMKPAMMAVDNAMLPEPVRVPAGERQKMSATGVGEITYECREKKDMAGQFEWAFVAPVATLVDAGGKTVGKYYAGPTWEANDGSRFTGKQLAVAPATPGDIPLQLVKAEPAMGAGAMQGISYVQRLKTQGGVAPSAPCGAANKMERRQVAYQADYVFYGR